VEQYQERQLSRICGIALILTHLSYSANFDVKKFEAQIMEEEDQLRFGFDLLDATKMVPEDVVPFTPLGKLTLNRNPRNYFAETEQVMVRYPKAPHIRELTHKTSTKLVT
jgi:hypothetical protein